MYTITETKTVPNYGTIMYRVKIAVDTAEEIPIPLDEWAVGSEMEVYENGGSRYKLGTDREWYPVNFKKGSGGGDNSEVADQVNQNTSSISLLTGRVSRIETNIGAHTVKSDVPENAVFTDTVYDDSEVREDIEQNKTDISSLKETKINGVAVTGELDSQTDLKIAGKVTMSGGIEVAGGTAANNGVAILSGANADGGFALGFGCRTYEDGYIAFGGGCQATAGGIAIGGGCQATANCASAIGGGCRAISPNGVAMGGGTEASGMAAVAIGSGSKASADYSTAIGFVLLASSEAQTVVGKSNIEDTEGKYAFIIGNGENAGASPRSNALAIGWDGKIYVGNSETGIDLNDLLNRIIALENK